MRLPFILPKTQENCSKFELLVFYRQLFSLLKAGLPIIPSLNIIISQTSGKFINRVVLVAEGLVNGKTLSLSLISAGFPSGDAGLIGIGEENGDIAEALARIIVRLDREISSTEKIRKALLYPTIVLSLSILSIVFMLVFIVPVFLSIFKEFNLKLPLLTRIIINPYYWHMLVIAVLAAGFSGRLIYSRENIKNRLPIIGRIHKNNLYTEFCRSLGYQLKGGVPLTLAIANIFKGMKSRCYAHALKSALQQLENGVGFSESLKRTGQFPKSLTQMVKVGEESGALDDILIQAAEYYQQETESAVGKLVNLVEPVSTLFVGGAVGLTVFAVIVPLFSMMDVIQ